jgi:C4-dicarboxylate-specific signal transduction histidine kinase
MASRNRSELLRYGMPLLLAAVALGLTLLQQGSVSITGYIFFYGAVIASSWFGGKGPGIVAVILSVLAVEYFFIPPIHSFSIRRESMPIFIEFAVTSVIIGWFSSWRKEAEGALELARDDLEIRVAQRTEELRKSNQQLREEMSERKRAEEAYSEAQAELARVTRLSALGTLAASISHEVNQPLAAVVTNADACAMWLSRDPPNLEEARDALDCIAREGTRASDVVRRVRAMFSNGATDRRGAQINEIIREVVALAQAELSKNRVTLHMELAENLPSSLVDRVQIQQVIVNLLLNGIEAMSGVTDRPRQLVIRSEGNAEQHLLVSVQDCGMGIDPKDQKRIFNAFFTTKPHGMGMGLSISQSIIQAHGGRLWASANPDRGATLQFTLPANPQTPP